MAQSSFTEKKYFGKIEKKCASLFEAACSCGALAANGSRNEISVLRSFGKNYGLAFQIKDDLSDFEFLGNDTNPDINKFRSTLPVIHAYSKMNKHEQSLFENISSKQTQESLRTIFHEISKNKNSEPLTYCAKKVDLYVDKAVKNIEPLETTPYKDYLIQMADSLRVRR